jgi:hypothetical protein
MQKAGKPTLVVYGDQMPTRSRTDIESMAAHIQIERLPNGKLSFHKGISGRSRFCHPTASF